ncbi:NHLP family bacteriocin export ABC transporter peptidase/permease/ATPase subunit [Massilia sp. W12]|uniref:NHLP family bacteriocin export ABC transporter peptidase/permease/ATPase subunit n=1 Tax=Massilia sp. W12 TaxID=3126507 RepID=UPI0030CD38F7
MTRRPPSLSRAAGWLVGDYAPLRTDTVLQLEVVECGAACLAMVLAWHGWHETLEELRIACGVSRDGSKASNIVKAARQRGLQAKGVRAEPADLRELNSPAIVFWNFNHFVVLEGFARGRAWLNDPAAGRRSVSEAEFDASFTGVALLFEKGPEFHPHGRPPGLLKPLLQRLRGSGDALRNLFLASLILTLPGLIAPAFSRLFVDFYLVQKLEDWLDALIAGMLFMALLRMLLTWLQQWALLRLNNGLALSWASRFVWHLLRMPLPFFQQRFAGEIGARVMMNDKLAQLVGGELTMCAAQMLAAAVFLFVMAQYNLWVMGAALALGLLNLSILAWAQRRTQEASQRLQMDQGKFVAALLQGTQQMEALKVASAENALFTRWLGLHAKVVNAEQSLGLQRLWSNIVPQMSAGLLLAAVLAVGGWQVMGGHLSLGMLVALLALAANLQAPLLSLVGVGAKLQEAQAYLRRIDDVMQHPLATEFSAPQTPPLAVEQVAGRVEIRNLCFGYSPLDPPLLDDFSLNIEAGQRIAIVGASGSGKSTLGRLLAGVCEAWSGEIVLDGRPLQQWPRLQLRAALAMVDQEISLFEASIRDNLTLWNLEIPQGWCVRAAKDAAIHEVISARAGGYATQVAEGGRNFSAGERQRLEIARALVGQPRVLVLDEATSALDPAIELHIMQALRRRGITCLIIAHRLSTVRDCDLILVMEQGRVVEQGTHAELLSARGQYWRLLEA